MCRWFAYISATEPCLLEDVLIAPMHSLTRQVYEHYLPGLIAHHPQDIGNSDHLIKARNSVYNIDGLGVAWYTSSHADFEGGDGAPGRGLRPAVYKTVQPPLNDMNFRSICGNTETRICLAHIRAASGTAIVPVNNHPFIFGRHAFMHNGVVSAFPLIRRELSQHMSQAAFGNINGGTDTEHLAALYMTYLTDGGDVASFEEEYPREKMIDALNKTISTVINLQQKLVGDQMRPNSLNLCATDGIKLVAFRFRNHATQQPPSLYYSATAGTTLNRKFPDNADDKDSSTRFHGKAVEEHGKHLIVASEPSTYKASEWHLIGRNQYLVATGDGHFQLGDIPYDDSWNAQDESEDRQVWILVDYEGGPDTMPDQNETPTERMLIPRPTRSRLSR